jgi:HEAT repeat protein
MEEGEVPPTVAGPRLDPERLQRLVAEKDVAALESTLLDLAAQGGNCKPAVVALIEVDTPQSWDAIGRFLAQFQTAVVAFTLADLEELVSHGAVRALGASLGNPSPVIRRAAVRALARQQLADAIPHLLRASRDPDADAAQAARATLLQRLAEGPAALGGVAERVLEGVLDLLEPRTAFEWVAEEHPENVRVVGAERIGRIADAEAAETLAHLIATGSPRLASVCWAGLERCAALSDAQLLPLLVHDDPEVVSRALALFAKSATRDDAGTFAAMSRAPERRIRAAALSGLARVLGADALPTLAVSLHDAAEIRTVAIELLGEIAESTPVLLESVNHRDPDLRRRAMIHLAYRGVITDELMPRYFEFLEGGASCTDQSDERYIDSLAAVARALGGGGHPEGLQALARLARSTLRRLRRVAVESIMAYAPDVRADALSELAGTWDRDVLKHVALGLWEVRDGRAAIPLIRVSRECRGTVVKKARQALREIEELEDCDILTSLFSQPYPSVRRFAAETLAEMGDPNAIPALLAASKDDDIEVQLAVFDALRPFAADEPHVKERMLEAVGYGDVSVRQAACEALGEARCVEAVPHLVKAIYNCFLRPRASEALRRIGDRKGILAIRRLERRERLFPKKRTVRPARGVANRRAAVV